MCDDGFGQRLRTCQKLVPWCILVAITACGDPATKPEPPPFVPEPTTIEVTPESALLQLPDSTLQLTAVVRDQNGDEMDVAIQWSSANPEIATVNSAGLVTALDEGSTQISAQYDTLVATAEIVVRGVRIATYILVLPLYAILPPADGVLQVRAYAWDQYGRRIQDATFQWSTPDPDVATVDQAGFVTARNEGTTRISARTDTVAISMDVVVGDDPERDVLTTFYHATGGPDWEDNTNWLTGKPFSEWEGVLTDDSSRVVALHLRSNGLAGEIPSAIGGLTKLRRLSLTENALTGPIPSSIWNLKRLYVVALGDNALTGSLPAEMVEATSVAHLAVSGNPMAGLLPEGMTQIPIYWLDFERTELCAPRGAAFQQWLSATPVHKVPPCPAWRHERLILTRLYEELGGSGWTRKDGWGSDAAVGEWAGVSVDGGGWVTGLDLKGNNVTGELPHQLVHLRSLAGLDVSGNPELGGSVQEWMRELDLDTFRFADTGVCAPPTAVVSDWLDGMDDWSGRECGGAASIVAGVEAVYLSQPVQNRDGGVPVMAGRDATLRVFVVADSINYFDSKVRATFYRNGETVHTAEMSVGGGHGIPLEVDEGRLDTSHNTLIPGEVLAPGLELVVELDPDGKLSLSEGSRRRFPESGTFALDVRQMPVMKLTIVPIQFEGQDTTYAAAASRMTTESQAIQDLLRIQPISDFDFSVRETLHLSEGEGFSLSGLEMLRLADGDPGYYVGVYPGAGVALLGGRVSFAQITGTTIVHEVGHNLNLRHAPCGGPQGIDPHYPHEGGRTGAWGLDPITGKLWSPNTSDIMTYCTQRSWWISDYSYAKALEYRLAEEAKTAARSAADRRRVSSLVLWGRAGPNEVVLDPAIVVDAVPSLPGDGGRYRIQGRSAQGGTLFSLRFDPMIEAESGEGYFAFALPVDAAWAGSLASITLSGPAGSDRLDATTDRPMAVVTDRATGRIRKLLRDFDTVPVAGPGEVVTVSYGLPDEQALRGRR